MNKLDLELFEILDSEINKKLEYWAYCELEDNIIIKYIDIDNSFFEHRDYEYTILWTWAYNEWIERVEINKILWHYPTTNTVLRYIQTKLKNKEWLEIHFFIEWIFIDWYELYITKEIIDYTDKQKQELINFLKTL